jgi:hypothetical protein
VDTKNEQKNIAHATEGDKLFQPKASLFMLLFRRHVTTITAHIKGEERWRFSQNRSAKPLRKDSLKN